MLVLKFGGTSVGKPERMKKIANLVTSTPGKKVVVLSALSGTTNALVSIGDHLTLGQAAKAEEEIATLEKHYVTFIKELFESEAFQAIGQEIISRYFILIRLLAAGQFDNKSYRELLAQGELISTELFYQHLQERKIGSRLFPALHFMSIDENEEPELEKISKRLKPLLASLNNIDIVITQGYICRIHLLCRNDCRRMKYLGAEVSQFGGFIKSKLRNRNSLFHYPRVIIMHSIDIRPDLNLLGLDGCANERRRVVAASPF